MQPITPGLFGLSPQRDLNVLPPVSMAPIVPPYMPLATGDPASSVQAPPTPAPQPFIWGGSGERLTDDDIAAQEKIAQQRMAAGMDFSPVQSWTQGAARVAQALVGGLEQHSLDKASAANVKANNDALALLAKPGANEATIASLLTDPTLSDGLRGYATTKLAALNKAPARDGHAQQLIDEGLVPGTPTFQARMNAFNTQQEIGTPYVYETYNPTTKAMDRITTTRAAVAGAAGQANPSAPPPAAVAYLQQHPDMAPHFDEKYGAGASQRYLTGGATSNGSRTFPVR